MAAVTDEQLAKLAAYINGEQPDARGEIGMYCPLHPDTRRSASLNINMGAWYCHAGCGGGSVKQLIDQEDIWVNKLRVAASAQATMTKRSLTAAPPLALPSMGQVVGWHQRLLDDREARRELWELRGINKQTLRKARVGYDGRYFKLPVFSPDGAVWNVRTYDTRPKNNRRKIWGIRGHNAPRLYPIRVLTQRTQPGQAVVICEGEWDALMVLQTGYHGVTRTGAAKVWDPAWNELFAGLRVFVCHDADHAGQSADDSVAEQLTGVAAEVHKVELPFPVRPKHGRDLTDLLRDDPEPGMVLGELMHDARRVG